MALNMVNYSNQYYEPANYDLAINPPTTEIEFLENLLSPNVGELKETSGKYDQILEFSVTSTIFNTLVKLDDLWGPRSKYIHQSIMFIQSTISIYICYLEALIDSNDKSNPENTLICKDTLSHLTLLKKTFEKIVIQYNFLKIRISGYLFNGFNELMNSDMHKTNSVKPFNPHELLAVLYKASIAHRFFSLLKPSINQCIRNIDILVANSKLGFIDIEILYEIHKSIRIKLENINKMSKELSLSQNLYLATCYFFKRPVTQAYIVNYDQALLDFDNYVNSSTGLNNLAAN